MKAGERQLDVSELEAPDPLVLTLDAVERLQRGEYLRMRHRRFPCLLFENLDQRGFEHRIRRGRDVVCEVFIWHRGDPVAEGAALNAAEELPEWRE